MVDEPAFASRDTSLLDLAPKPLVVVYRSRQKVQSNRYGTKAHGRCICGNRWAVKRPESGK